MLWIVVTVLLIALVILGVMLSRSREALSATSALLAAERHRAKKAIEELTHEHDRAIARHQRAATQQLEGAHLPLASDLFEGLDALDMAIHNADTHPNTTKKDLLDGIVMVHASLTRALKKHDITPIAPLPSHDTFDPSTHQAISVIEDDSLPSHTVAALLRSGWQHPSKVLRPAMVHTTRMSAVSAHTQGDDEPTTLDFSSPGDHHEEATHKEEEEVAQHATSSSST